RFPRRTGTRVLTLGNAGGRLKASTGYALVRIHDDAVRIAASLRRSGDPFGLPADPELPRWLDGTLLDLVRARGPATIPVFMAMFRDNPVDRALRFLDEAASVADLTTLVATLPGRGPFVAAALRVLTRRAAAAWRFWALTAGVIGGPALAFAALAPTDAATAGPAMLVFLLGPALVGNALAWGLPRLPARRAASAVGLAVGLTAAIIAVGALGAVAGGALVLGGKVDLAAALTGALGGALTSTLEELGWAAGGLTVARAGLGPRLGVLGLGLVWAGWHLVVAALGPPEVVLGLFGTAGPLGAWRIGLFVAGCVAYRVLLTALRDRADAVWPAVAAHVTGNVLMGGLIASGWATLAPEGPWLLFPGPTGLPFLAATVAAAAWLRRTGSW
ncbi:MAG: lycopene cyclase family protein, partial [Myxococcota bacterium]